MTVSAPACALLARWARGAEKHWYDLPQTSEGQPLGCYGTGYNSWGVQTNQKYAGAMAALACKGGKLPGIDRKWALERALAALRFSLESHLTGKGSCTDGTRWGHTWISALGIERMMYGVYLLEPHLTDRDRSALSRVLVSEASWIADCMRRGKHRGIVAGAWNDSGMNVPESNLWNGALLWRTAAMYPQHRRAPRWREKAHQYLINAVSVPADGSDSTPLAGRPIRERFVGPNFFPNLALDHHGYLNVGYMVICMSNAAMLHFDLKSQGLPRPETLDHHQSDLWSTVRRMIFWDGRLARIGGDSRVRYAYCQEYLLPSLLYAADRWQDPFALTLAERQIRLISREQAANQDGSFYGERLSLLHEENPYYFTRLESDRACALGTALAWNDIVECRSATKDLNQFEDAVAGTWCEPEHGAVLHRSRTRLASFSWRAHGLTQGMCQPPQKGHLAEWQQNLTGVIRFVGDDGTVTGGQTRQRQLVCHTITNFEGGFATCGAVLEGMRLCIPEGWKGTESALHQIAFVALPDAHTVIGMELCRTANRRTYVAEVKGLHLNVPNDVYNGRSRAISTEGEKSTLVAPPKRDEVLNLHSRWVNIDGCLGVVGLFGAEQIQVSRSINRRGGRYGSLFVEEICWPCLIGTRAVDPETLILDSGWAVLSGASPRCTRSWASANPSPIIDVAPPALRAVHIKGLDGNRYLIAANFGSVPAELSLSLHWDELDQAPPLVSARPGSDRGDETPVRIQPCTVRVWARSSKRGSKHKVGKTPP